MATETVETPTIKRKRVLLIEDDVDFNMALARGLSHCGYDVDSVFDGARGLEKGETKTPNLVLLDIRLPKVNGWKVLKKMKESPNTAEIPIVIITGAEEASLKTGIRHRNVRRVIHKPASPRDIAHEVNEILGGPLENQPKVSDPFVLGGGDITYRPNIYILSLAFLLIMSDQISYESKPSTTAAASIPKKGVYQRILEDLPNWDDGIWLKHDGVEQVIGIYKKKA